MLKNRIIPCLDVKNGRVVKGINFDTQITEQTEGGRLRPDFYVYTPDDGVIVIDSKAPMKLYKEAIKAENEKLTLTSTDLEQTITTTLQSKKRERW